MRTIRHLLGNKTVWAIDARFSAFDAARYMSERVIGAVPVVDENALVGMFTERDLMTRVVVPGHDPARIPVRDVMTRDIVVAAPTDLRSECIARMKARHCRHLPILDGGRLVGTISMRDLLADDIEEKLEEVKLLTEYVQYVPPGHGES